MTRAIGRFFAEEWQQALTNTGAFFTPYPSAEMTTAELQAIAATLQGLVDYWLNQVISNTNADAIANSQAIADLEQSKLNTVTALINTRLPVTTTNGQTANEPVYQTETEEKSWLPIILIGAVALYFFTRKKKTA